MAIPFSQTLESRRVDIYYLLMAGMLIAVILAVSWGMWFFTTPVIVYETSQNVSIADKGIIRNSFIKTGRGARRARPFRIRQIIADFPAESLEHIKRKQQGYFFPEKTLGKQSGAIPATVIGIRPNSSGTGYVILKTKFPADLPDPFKNFNGGIVRIAVSQVTPAMILARTSGLKKDTPPVSSAPRKAVP